MSCVFSVSYPPFPSSSSVNKWGRERIWKRKLRGKKRKIERRKKKCLAPLFLTHSPIFPPPRPPIAFSIESLSSPPLVSRRMVMGGGGPTQKKICSGERSQGGQFGGQRGIPQSVAPRIDNSVCLLVKATPHPSEEPRFLSA